MHAYVCLHCNGISTVCSAPPCLGSAKFQLTHTLHHRAYYLHLKLSAREHIPFMIVVSHVTTCSVDEDQKRRHAYRCFMVMSMLPKVEIHYEDTESAWGTR